jgi:hypothetical protein
MDTHSIPDSPTDSSFRYQDAVARAVEWLGERYLLAKPINAPGERPALRPALVTKTAGARVRGLRARTFRRAEAHG